MEGTSVKGQSDFRNMVKLGSPRASIDRKAMSRRLDGCKQPGGVGKHELERAASASPETTAGESSASTPAAPA
jgi:hypothetical protein